MISESSAPAARPAMPNEDVAAFNAQSMIDSLL
nr:MAG TPA: hypothetical protein [Caudoviricetes sp.]